jgi:hypothetical protein
MKKKKKNDTKCRRYFKIFSFQLLIIQTIVIQVSISAQCKWYKYSLNIAPKTVGKYLKGKCGKPQFGSLKEYDLFPENQNQL